MSKPPVMADSRDMIVIHQMFRREFQAIPALVSVVPQETALGPGSSPTTSRGWSRSSIPNNTVVHDGPPRGDHGLDQGPALVGQVALLGTAVAHG